MHLLYSVVVRCLTCLFAQDHLPGLESLDKSVYFINITYPRFLDIPSNAHAQGADLLLELRVGRSGLGDDWLYRYVPNDGWKQIGRYLEVRKSISFRVLKINYMSRRVLTVSCCPEFILESVKLMFQIDNAYVNGLDFDSHGVLHTTW